MYSVRPQAMARLGLAYEAVSKANPGIVYVGAVGFGQDGPYAARPALDDLMQTNRCSFTGFDRDVVPLRAGDPAGVIVEASGRALRPWPKLDAIELPNALPVEPFARVNEARAWFL